MTVVISTEPVLTLGFREHHSPEAPEDAMRYKSEAGQAVIFTAVAMVALMGFAGLAVDMGLMRYEKRAQQSAADGAAIAGADELRYNAGA